MNFLKKFVTWLFGLFVTRTREAGAAEERERINETNTARIKRQDEVVKKPVTDDDLQKSLKDGSF